jgi:hypothetical protein
MAMEIHGTIQVPRFVDQDAAGARLVRGPDGQVIQNGTAEAPFVVVVPKSVMDGTFPGPVRALQFGHGFFGDLGEVTGGFVRGFANEKGFVVFGVEWWGMDQYDQGIVADRLINGPQETMLFVERIHQGMVNQLALTEAIQAASGFAAVPELQKDGAPIFDKSTTYYYGISQGHILGGTFLALSSKIQAGALSVGGAGFSHMMMRSSNFVQFLAILNLHAQDPIEQTKFIALTQHVCDRFDPLTYAPMVFDSPIEPKPEGFRVLMQTGIGDPQVPNMTARMHARALGLPLITPTLETPTALQTSAAPQPSGFVEFDFGVESPRPGDLPNLQVPSDDPVHEGVRRSVAGKAQIDAFFTPGGVVTATCDGSCDPE